MQTSGALTVGAVILTGCNPPDDDKAVVQRDQNGQKTGLVIFTDAVTKCDYVRTIGRGGITPRMGRDGKQMCGS